MCGYYAWTVHITFKVHQCVCEQVSGHKLTWVRCGSTLPNLLKQQKQQQQQQPNPNPNPNPNQTCLPDEARDGWNIALKWQLEVKSHLLACLIV